jgi:threonine aldolase
VVFDFRSDTVTQPTAAMRAAMFSAPLGDDVLDGDPSVRVLEAEVASLLGKQGALFVPSGIMANQVAIGAWTQPGEELICERSAHIVCWEGGAVGHLHGVQTRLLTAEGGALDPLEVERAIRPASLHCPRTSLLCLEQTCMGSGDGAPSRARHTCTRASSRRASRWRAHLECQRGERRGTEGVRSLCGLDQRVPLQGAWRTRGFAGLRR